MCIINEYKCAIAPELSMLLHRTGTEQMLRVHDQVTALFEWNDSLVYHLETWQCDVILEIRLHQPIVFTGVKILQISTPSDWAFLKRSPQQEKEQDDVQRNDISSWSKNAPMYLLNSGYQLCSCLRAYSLSLVWWRLQPLPWYVIFFYSYL